MAVPIITLERRAEDKRPGKNNAQGAQSTLVREDNRLNLETHLAATSARQGEAYSEQENIIGVLKVFNKREGDLLFDNDDLNIFETFASQIGVALAIAERNTTLSELVHGVCHEIRNKLGMIDPNIVLIGEDLDSSEESVVKGKITDKLNRINIVAHQAREFVEDLLAFSVSHFQNRKKLDINMLIEEAITQILASSRNIKNIENIELVREYFEGGVLCDVYRTPFIHIIQNIVINAFEAMDKNEKGFLTIRTSKDRPGKIASITISDNGKGISEEDLPKIYKATFYNKPGGNGLGLWLVKTYLPQMDGMISEQSRLDHGTTFTIQLPIANA
jgi:signal transduction histidine kinase